MNRRLVIVAVLAMVPVLMGSSQIPDALGANNDVCGLQLCSEIDGGRDAWVAANQAEQKKYGNTSEMKDVAMISLPVHRGYYDGGVVYYIITEASEPSHADVITASQGWTVQYVPSLQMTPQDARSTTYMFTNGVSGSGVHGYQSEVFTSMPSQTEKYSPLTGHVHVTWTEDAIPRILVSERAILAAAAAGDVILTEIDVVINMPRFELTPAQASMLEMNAPDRRLLLPLHYAYYEGETVYKIVLESSDKTHADVITAMQGLESVYTPVLEGALEQASSTAYFFTNGVECFGTHAFQRNVLAAVPGDDGYSPITSHVHVTWMDGFEPERLKSEADILAAADAGKVILTDLPVAINMPVLQLGADQIAMLPEEFTLRGGGSTGMAVIGAEMNNMQMAMMPDADDSDSSSMDMAAQEDADDSDSSSMDMAAQEDADDSDSSSMDMAAQEDADDSDSGSMDMAAQEETASAEDDALPPLRLARASVAVDIPLHMGYYDGQSVYYVITDSNDPVHAGIITENQGWRVELAPFLGSAADESLATAYMFTNGIDGDGIHGFQGEVFTSTPEQPDLYSALTKHMHVTWADGADAHILDSEAAILDAAEAGHVELLQMDVVINMPQIMWPGGQMPVRDDAPLSDESPYGGGQILEIDTDDMSVTFVAHRGWGPDGRTAYYIVTDATPSGPANMMGVVAADTAASLIANPAAVDLYQFTNGIPGPGPLGFQPGIATAALGDSNYSPMWRIYLITWNDPSDAKLLETIDDITSYLDEGLITVSIARPMDSDHIVNCPFIDPFQ